MHWKWVALANIISLMILFTGLTQGASLSDYLRLKNKLDLLRDSQSRLASVDYQTRQENKRFYNGQDSNPLNGDDATFERIRRRCPPGVSLIDCNSVIVGPWIHHRAPWVRHVTLPGKRNQTPDRLDLE
ncbi:unnamed protein product [Owenia fusiformis]|uniref:Uncharacterized protein n=1 Tax=Owenia fusiformis TaxID=6347 RepID=A0A8S4P514_OWEFU|nr:unnamed protein product [Owenia fusiformis]